MRVHLPVFINFAFRSLLRSKARSILSVVGVAVACSLALGEVSLIRAEVGLYMRNISESGVGHFRVTPRDWDQSRDPSLRLRNWQSALKTLRENPDVLVATPRARLQGMLAMGTKMVGVEIAGVDSTTEAASFRYVRKMESGRYLLPSDSKKMVIGKSIAEKLKISVGDDVVVTVVDNSGEMKSDMFEVLGIVNLGSKQVEESVCQVTLSDIESLSGIKGASEIAVLLKNPDEIDSVVHAIEPTIASENPIIKWDEIVPEGRFMVVFHEVWARLITLILVFVAFVGVASAQLTSILERQKEFAILSAIGMGSRRMLSLIFSEAFLLGTLSFLATIVLSGPIIYYFSKVGFRVLGRENLTVLGTVIDPIYYVDFGSWFFGYAAVLSYLSMIAASIYPAVLTIRLNPMDALRVSQ